MRKSVGYCAVALVLAGLLATSIDAQTRTGFVTSVSSNVLIPGKTVAISAIFPNVQKLPPLASREAVFLLGFRYNPRLSPFVLPPIPIGKATFKRVPFRGGVKLVATIRFQVPKIRLPANFRFPVYFQGVAFTKARNSRVSALPAKPAPAVLRAGR